MSTTSRQDARKKKHMDYEISILCGEALSGTNFANFHSSILGANILTPQKVLQQVEAICKRFLWNGDTQTKGKALVAWDTIC